MREVKRDTIRKPDPFTSDIDYLREAVKAFDYNDESFNQQFSATELLKIRDAWLASGWDIVPDSWSEAQVQDAIEKGHVPDWNDDETPKPSSVRIVD